MARYELKDLAGNIIEAYDYPDPEAFIDNELKDAVADLKIYIDGLPAAQKAGLTKLFRVLKRLAQGAGLQE